MLQWYHRHLNFLFETQEEKEGEKGGGNAYLSEDVLFEMFILAPLWKIKKKTIIIIIIQYNCTIQKPSILICFPIIRTSIIRTLTYPDTIELPPFLISVT